MVIVVGINCLGRWLKKSWINLLYLSGALHTNCVLPRKIARSDAKESKKKVMVCPPPSLLLLPDLEITRNLLSALDFLEYLHIEIRSLRILTHYGPYPVHIAVSQEASQSASCLSYLRAATRYTCFLAMTGNPDV